ncbi:MAG: alpha/beta hydrolase [Microbacterium sp.]
MTSGNTSRLFALTRGEGVPLLAIHGFGSDHSNLLNLDPVLAESAVWQRIYVDLPGMGGTSAGPEIDGTDAVVDSVIRFIDETIGSAPFALLGISFGGMVARSLAAHYGAQVIGLALVCAVFVADHANRDVPPRRVLRTDPALIASLDSADAEDYGRMAVVQSPENWELHRRHVIPGLRTFDVLALDRIRQRYELTELPELVAPPYRGVTSIITARYDEIVGYRDAWRALDHYPNSTFLLIDQAGHNAHLDRPDVVGNALREWLERMSEAVDR